MLHLFVIIYLDQKELMYDLASILQQVRNEMLPELH